MPEETWRGRARWVGQHHQWELNFEHDPVIPARHKADFRLLPPPILGGPDGWFDVELTFTPLGEEPRTSPGPDGTSRLVDDLVAEVARHLGDAPKRETVLGIGFEDFWLDFSEKHPAMVTRLGPLNARELAREAFDAGADVQLVSTSVAQHLRTSAPTEERT